MSDEPKTPDTEAPKPDETPPAPDARKPLSPEGEALQTKAIEILRTIYDPEIPVDIYELGLIYEVNVDEETSKIQIVMTLTSPTCPVAETLPGEVETKVKEGEGIEDVDVELVWDPPWGMERLSDAAKLQMGLT